MKKVKLIVVLGMHRSGTSAITRGLQVLGVELGDRMMPPVAGVNEKGFWEDDDVTEFNVEILNSIGSNWDCVSLINSTHVEQLHKQGFFLRAVEMLRKKVGDNSIYGFKDPRVAKLLPFWREVFAHCQFEVNYVLVIRHPLSVAHSLLKRNGLEREYSYLLWLGHVITSLTYSEGCNRVCVDYDLLMQSPEHELNRIAKQFDLEVNQASLQTYANDFLEQKLRHSTYDANDLSLDSSCPNIVRNVYNGLLAVASDKKHLEDVEFIDKINSWDAEVKSLEILLQLTDKLYQQKTLATQAMIESKDQLAITTQKLSLCEWQNASLQSELAKVPQSLALSEQNSSRLQSELVRVSQKLSLHELKNSSLQQENSRLHQLDIEQSSLIKQLGDDIVQLRSSSSWKITKPLRALSHLVKQGVRLARSIKYYFSISADSNKTEAQTRTEPVGNGDATPVRKENCNFEASLIEKFNSDDQISVNKIDLLRSQFQNGLISKSTIIFDHNIGGGSNLYSSEMVKKIIKTEEHVLRVYCIDAVWSVQLIAEGIDLVFNTPSMDLLFDMLVDSPSTDIIINSFYGYPDIPGVTEKIIHLAKALNAKLDFKIHDFYALCPSPHLSDFEQKYCGVPLDKANCTNCLSKNLGWYHDWFPVEKRPFKIDTWRKPFAKLLDAANVITVFDPSSVDILKKGFDLSDEKIKIIPHSSSYFHCDRSVDICGPLHIGVLGTLTPIKGANVVKELCEHIDRERLGIPVTIVGNSHIDLPAFVDIHGAYKTCELAKIVEQKGINIVVMLSIVPETFSYTISEAMQMSLPILAFDLGAQGNRVSNYELGRVIPMEFNPELILKEIRSTLASAKESKLVC